MIRYVVSDLDGTLIDTKNECSKASIDAIRNLKEAGIHFSLCSGRPIDSVKGMLKGWHLDDLVDDLIGSNGAEILNLHTGKRQLLHPLSAELTKEIIEEYEKLGLIGTIYDSTVLYVSRNSKEVERVAKRLGLEIIVTDLFSKIDSPMPKEMFIMDKALMPLTEAYYESHLDNRYIGFKTAQDLFEIINSKASKGVGVQVIADEFGFKPDEIMAFGDTTNDIPMFTYAKYGICMANGSEDAKQAAYAITPSIEEDGFAKYIQEHLKSL